MSHRPPTGADVTWAPHRGRMSHGPPTAGGCHMGHPRGADGGGGATSQYTREEKAQRKVFSMMDGFASNITSLSNFGTVTLALLSKLLCIIHLGLMRNAAPLLGCNGCSLTLWHKNSPPPLHFRGPSALETYIVSHFALGNFPHFEFFQNLLLPMQWVQHFVPLCVFQHPWVAATRPT